MGGVPLEKLVMIRDVTYLAVVLRIFAAVILGGMIGLEREMKNRAAGLRTYILVCVGARDRLHSAYGYLARVQRRGRKSTAYRKL